jgi:dolichyl-phosphate beta-glucosyltransferase
LPTPLDITVVVPAYDEERRLGPTLLEMERWLKASGLSFEVIVVDDGSRDGTAALAEEFAGRHDGFRLERLGRNLGKGAAVRRGLAVSRGTEVLFSDADLSTPMEDLPILRQELADGADLVMASRALPDSNVEIRQAWVRDRMGKTFNGLLRLVTRIPFLDTQCGFKLFRGDAARSLSAQMSEDGFAFDVEVILLANKRGLTIRDVPVTWRNDEGTRVRAVQDSWDMLLSMIRITRRVGRYRG